MLLSKLSVMRKYYILFIASLFLFLSCSTNRTINKAFNKYGDQPGVTTISLPGWVIKLGAKLADMSPEERQLIKSIDKIKVLTIEDPELNNQVNLHDEFYHKITGNKNYHNLVMVNDKKEKVSVLGNIDDDETIRELIVLVGGEENTIVYLKGDLKLENVNGIIDMTSD